MTEPANHGDLLLCCGMPRAASTLQYQLASRISGLRQPTTPMGWYDGQDLRELVNEVPTGQTWVYKVHSHSPSYHFEEAAESGHVTGLSTSRDLRMVIASYRKLHSKSMWWVARHRVLEGMIRDHRRWSESSHVLMQTYEDLTADAAGAVLDIASHLGVSMSEQEAAKIASEFDRSHQIARTSGRTKADAGTNSPADLLQVGHVSATEQARDMSGMDEAWVEAIAGRWLTANAFPLRSTSIERLAARLRYSPRWFLFAKWHIAHQTVAGSLLGRMRLGWSWCRYLGARVRLLPFMARRELARTRSRLGRAQSPDGATTVVMVSWNSEDIIADTLRMIEQYSPGDTRIIVVDNGSVDSTCEIASSNPRVKLIRLRRNIGHGPAMDLGFLDADTEYCVALDVDAFPIRADWIDTMRAELVRGASVAGAHWRRHVGFYVHPCCLMMRRSRFAEMRHTFENRFLPGVNPSGQMGVRYWDTGERISMREGAANLATFPMTESLRHTVGMIFGDFVYHNGSTTRASDSPEWIGSNGIEGAIDVWRRAIETHEHSA